MPLDDTTCYRAMVSRDRRFEGRFVVAVTTTRIYCRPGCPARLPKPEHNRFYPSAAAAEERGYRPCLRCRPDASPDSPAWAGTSATVTRAMRLISDGAIDEVGIEELADRLGISPRHLRRLFAQHLGASPISFAQTRRLHFARKLIDETALPMTVVASCAGFSSIRRFNEAVQQTFRRAPTELRKAFRRPGPLPLPRSTGPEIELRLPFRPPFDWGALIQYLAERAIPGVEGVTDGSYRRSVALGDASGSVEVCPAADARSLLLRLSAPSVPPDLMRIVERVRRLFDLQAEPMGIDDHIRSDPLLAQSVATRPGLRIPGAWDPFELGVRAILGQQITVQGASTLAGRLVRAFGRPLPAPAGAGLTHLFPTPSALAEGDVAAIGLPSARAAALRGFAAAVRDGRIAFGIRASLDDTIAELVTLPGIGAWTAHYIALRALGEPDAFPAADLGLRRAAADGAGPLTERQLSERAEAWRPWRGYAAMHLWANLANPANDKRRSE